MLFIPLLLLQCLWFMFTSVSHFPTNEPNSWGFLQHPGSRHAKRISECSTRRAWFKRGRSHLRGFPLNKGISGSQTEDLVQFNSIPRRTSNRALYHQKSRTAKVKLLWSKVLFWLQQKRSVKYRNKFLNGLTMNLDVFCWQHELFMSS